MKTIEQIVALTIEKYTYCMLPKDAQKIPLLPPAPNHKKNQVAMIAEIKENTMTTLTMSHFDAPAV
jgi:hypothetical protein